MHGCHLQKYIVVELNIKPTQFQPKVSMFTTYSQTCTCNSSRLTSSPPFTGWHLEHSHYVDDAHDHADDNDVADRGDNYGHDDDEEVLLDNVEKGNDEHDGIYSET